MMDRKEAPMKIRVYSKSGKVAVGTFLNVRDSGDGASLVVHDDEHPESETVFPEADLSYIEIDRKATFVSTGGEHAAVEEKVD
jgi:hypothetical protein